MKLKKTAVVIGCLCIAAVVGVLSYTQLTTAFLTADDRKENTAVMGRMDTYIEETLEGLEKKNIYVTNSGNVDCYVRVMIKIPQIKDSEGGFYTATVKDCNDRQIDLDTEVSIASGSGVWTRDDEDGYWYYSLPAAPGTSIPFLNSIKYENLKEDVNKEQLDVVIYVESAQADNREIVNPKDAFIFTNK